MSTRCGIEGELVTVFRYDLVWEFVSLIVEQRIAVPTFHDGLQVQIVADGTLESYASKKSTNVSLAYVLFYGTMIPR